ncbi:MAG: glycosyltransferase family 4 protein [Pseudomonadota bacterium]
MRLLYAVTFYTPHLSGLTRGIEPVIRHFSETADQVEVLTAQHDPALPRQEHDGPVLISRVPVAFRIGKGPVMPRFAGAAWASMGRADLVHVIAPQLESGLIALIARIRGRKVVLSYVCSMRPGLLATVALWTSHLIAGLLAHRIIALSEDYAKQSRFCRLFWRKLSFVPVPVPNFDTPEPRPKRPGDNYRIGFVGRISPEKNIDLLLDAVPLLRDVLDRAFTVELAGPGEPSGTPGAEALEDRIAGVHLPELRRLGPLSEDDLDRFYREIDVLVLPSDDRIEAYGMVQVEAMLRGTPCVTSDRPGMRQPIGLTGFGRVFAPGSPKELVKAVAAVLTDGPPRSPKPSEVRETFSPAAIFATFASLYRSLLKAKSR